MIGRHRFGAVSALALVWLALSAAAAVAQSPAVAIPTRTLVVAGDVAKPITLTLADLKALPRTRVEVKEDARTIVYEGVLVGELLKRAGAPAGSDMRGNAVASYVLASANDGYQVVFAVTAPYMHDGSVATLEEAIDHYAAGGRAIAAGPYQGIGRDNPNKTASIGGFTLTAEQRGDLIAFLQSLTDDALLNDSRFANPWPSRPRR